MTKNLRPFAAALMFVLALAIGTSGFAQFSLKGDQRILFIGDSITQDGRYVDLVQGYLWARYPEGNATILNAGLSSETVSGITEPVHPYPRPNINDRIKPVLELSKPEVVFVCYGMNDGIYHPIEERITSAYRKGLEQLLVAIDAAGAKTYLLSPPVFDVQAPGIQKNLANASKDEPYGYRRPFEQYDQTLAALTEIVQSYKPDPRVIGVFDVHSSTRDFLAKAKQVDSNFTYGDGVHPPLEGHAAIARAILIDLGESEETINNTFAWYFGIRPPGISSEQLPTHDQSKRLREMLFKRGRALSAAVRTTAKGEDKTSITEFNEGPQMANAAEDARKIKSMISEMRNDAF